MEKKQRCLTYIEYSYLDSEFHGKNVNSLNIFHQNLRGLRNKRWINTFFCNRWLKPHVFCLSKHHMVEQDLLHLTLDSYLLVSSFCRHNLQRGDVCVFLLRKISVSTKHILYACKEQDLEIRACDLKYLYNTKSEFLILKINVAAGLMHVILRLCVTTCQ
jgi:hypothetical protein